MNDVNGEPRSLIPVLQPFYERVIPLAWPVVRFAVGWNLLIHAWFKALRGPTAVAVPFVQMGLEPALLYAWTTFCIEGIAGIGLILGLFTRFCAAAAAIELFV